MAELCLDSLRVVSIHLQPHRSHLYSGGDIYKLYYGRQVIMTVCLGLTDTIHGPKKASSRLMQRSRRIAC